MIKALCSKNAFASKAFLTGPELAVIASSSAVLCKLDMLGVGVLVELPLWGLTLGGFLPGGSGNVREKGKRGGEY